MINWEVLGYEAYEVQTVDGLLRGGAKFTPKALEYMGFNSYEVRRIRQIHAIMIGKTEIESADDLVNHLRKVHTGRRLGMQDLLASKILRVPRKAFIYGIKDPTFKMYNSENYSKFNRLYDVVSVGGQRIHIDTARKPVLKFKQSKVVEGVIEITELMESGRVKIAVNREYSTLCNRFVIAVGFRKPETHHGCAQIVAFDGTRVFVYCRSIGKREKLDFMLGSTRVYDHGIYKEDILPKLMNVSEMTFLRVGGKHIEYQPYTEEYKLIIADKEDETEEDELQIID